MKIQNHNNIELEKIKKWIKDFDTFYHFNSSFYFKTEKQYSLGNKDNKICRFCGKGPKVTTFKSNAHLAPKLIGNKFISSHYECDDCNNLFGKYETDLANFIGIRGYFETIENYEQTRKRVYRSKSGKSYFYTSKRGIELTDLGKEIFEELPDNKGLKCIAVKSPYIPLNVYKSLIKIVLSTLKDETIEQFRKTTDFITSKKYDKEEAVKALAKLSLITFTDFYTDYPIVYTFVRNPNLKIESKNEIIIIPNKTFIIYFKSFCYQLFLPFDKNDVYPENKTINIKLIFHPPSIYDSDKSNYKTFLNYKHQINNLSSTIQERNEKDEFYFIYSGEPIVLEYTDEERDMLVKKYGLRI